MTGAVTGAVTGASTGAGAHLHELATGAIAAGGGCVARLDDGRVAFVRHALPGERVLATITEEHASYVRADAVEVLDRSPDRVEPPCVYAGPGRCGGCDWQHVSIDRQRALKADLVAEQLRRVARLELAVEVEAAPGHDDGLGWRTRVQFAVDDSGRLGLHRHRSQELQLVERCLIASPGVESLGVEQLAWPGASEVEVFATTDGDQRVVRVAAPRRRSVELPRLDAGVVLNGRVARAPAGVRFEVLGRSYDVTAGAFWQVHSGAAELLAQVVLDALEARPGESVVDLYAGVGLYSGVLAEAVGPSGSVLAVERDARAFADAEANLADLPQAKVRHASVSARLVAEQVGSPDLVVLDPAREGAGRQVTAALAALVPRPRRIAYVACDPASFARDLRVLRDAGWSLRSLRAFDLFPMTEHVELLGVLEPPLA